MATVKTVRPSAIRKTVYYKKPASTAFAVDTLVAPNEDATSDTFVAATSSTERVLGVLRKAVAATDSDYASETRMPLEVDIDGEFEFTVGTGTADANDEQGYIDLKDADEVDVTASTIDAVFVTRYVSGTKVRGHIVRWAHLEAPATN